MPSTAEDGSLNWITWFSRKSAAESTSLASTDASLALGSSGKGSSALADLGDPLPKRVTPSVKVISRAEDKLSTYFNAFSCNQKIVMNKGTKALHNHNTSLHKSNLQAQRHVSFRALLDHAEDTAHQPRIIRLLVESRHGPRRRDQK